MVTDRVTVALLSLAVFLTVLALLGAQLRSAAAHAPAHRVVVVRRIYRTTVIETVRGGAPGGPSVTQSVSSSGGAVSGAAAPATRTS
ncbi:MAG TPA: hypothetical protein VFN87_18215 [Solirubrobacteraceae bacterium]|nr:hypothetical protein [Solirubrobacteraceae bacterium]